jgi:hypothetical protein
MSPPEVVSNRDVDRFLCGRRDPDECQHLGHSYLTWQP